MFVHRNMKKLISLFILILIACFLIVPSYAHSGKTDANGGHHDYYNISGLGSYHYHHGYPPHLHENGTCPYDFVDITSSSGGGGNTSDYKAKYLEVKEKYDNLNNAYNKLESENNDLEAKIHNFENRISNLNQKLTFMLIASIILAITVIVFLLDKISSNKSFIKLKKEFDVLEAKNKETENQNINLKNDINELEKEIKVLKKPYLNSQMTFSSVYEDTANEIYVRVAPSTKKYHTLSCRIKAKNSFTAPIYEVPKNFEPCKVCNPPELQSKDDLLNNTFVWWSYKFI